MTAQCLLDKIQEMSVIVMIGAFGHRVRIRGHAYENVVWKRPIQNVVWKSPIQNVVWKRPIQNFVWKRPIQNQK
jgi:hypothetical protein